MYKLATLGLLGLSALLAACDETPRQSAPPAPGTAAPVEPWFTPAQVETGRKIYAANCAGCHGNMLQGEPDWQRPRADGLGAAPPLNGRGHSWHHPLPQLRQMISQGGPTRMPAWGDTLSEEQIDAVIAYFQSVWPKEVYQSWATRPHH